MTWFNFYLVSLLIEKNGLISIAAKTTIWFIDGIRRDLLTVSFQRGDCKRLNLLPATRRPLHAHRQTWIAGPILVMKTCPSGLKARMELGRGIPPNVRINDPLL